MHKTLNSTAVKSAAEQLIFNKQATTTLDVKNLLRKQGYFARQQDVSSLMNVVARQEAWTFTTIGNHRIYRFNGDTNVAIHKYLEVGNLFWEVLVDEKQLTISEGSIGTDGSIVEQSFPSNRQAVHKAQGLIAQKEHNGFVEGKDQRPSIELRKKYQRFQNLAIDRCVLGYYGVSVMEQKTCKLKSEQKDVILNIEKGAGYEFIFDLPKSKEKLLQILELQNWDAVKIKPSSMMLTGEKVLQTAVIDNEGNTLNDAEIIEDQAPSYPVSMIANNQKLYNISIQFETGKRLVLNKFQMDLEKEIMPIALRLLRR